MLDPSVKINSPQISRVAWLNESDRHAAAGTAVSQHAFQRSRQRSVSPFLLDLVMDFGTCVHDHRGCERYFFDKHAKRRLCAYLGRQTYRRIEEALDVFVVVADGRIVTTGWQYEKVRNT